MFHEGQQFGEYALVKKLGQGGFGEVWLAAADGRRFALKFPHRDQVDWKSITQEIGVWTLCGRHPNVMPLVGARNFDGQIAIISEYAPDGSLEDLLKKRGGLSIDEAVIMTDGILRGLQHLHTSGIVHSDLKPANILLDGQTPRLADFGISRVSKHTDTMSQTIAGTLKYMAPESFDGKRNIQTDVWAVGVILYQMLTGTFPYQEEETVQFIAAVVLKEPRPLPDFVPPPLRNIIAAALAKDAARRFQSAEQMRQSLSTVAAQNLGIKDPGTGGDHLPPADIEQITVQRPARTVEINKQTFEPPRPNKPLNRLIILGISSLVLLLLGIGGTGAYYLVKNITTRATPTPLPRLSPPPSGSPSATRTLTPTPTATPTPVKAEFETPGKIEEVLKQFEERAGGKLKISYVSINFDDQQDLRALIQDPKISENYDIYWYRNGAIEKTPEKLITPGNRRVYPASAINWSAIPGLVKTAREKAQELEGAKNPGLFVMYTSRALEIEIKISGTRKNLVLTASPNGDIKKTGIE
jgi:serine/threonine protein kinase